MFSAVLPVANGTYFLKNKKTNRYADIQNGTMAAGTQIEQQDFDGSYSQRWVFTHLGDSTYSIKSANSPTPCYLGVKDDLTANDQPIVLRTGSLTDGMKWKVSKTTSGAYKLTPLTGEADGRVLAVGWYVANTNGIDIEQRDYVADDNYKDEWILTGFEDVTFVSIPSEGHNHTITATAFEYAQSVGLNSKREYSQVDKESLSALIATTKFFYIRSHGAMAEIVLNGDSLTISDLGGYVSGVFQYCEFILYGACLTGSGGADANNLVNATYDCGAKTVIGFTKSVNCQEMNIWAEAFFTALKSNKTVFDACVAASSFVSQLYPIMTTNSWYIAGESGILFQ